MLKWPCSVGWVIKLNTPKCDIMATDVAVDFDNELRKLKLQIYQNISPAKVREDPLTNVQNRVGVWRYKRARKWPITLPRNRKQAIYVIVSRFALPSCPSDKMIINCFIPGLYQVVG